jgi:hypothetical protein
MAVRQQRAEIQKVNASFEGFSTGTIQAAMGIESCCACSAMRKENQRMIVDATRGSWWVEETGRAYERDTLGE